MGNGQREPNNRLQVSKTIVMKRVTLWLAALLVAAGAFGALVLRTNEFDLAPCAVYNEFQRCGHQTDYRIGLRVTIFLSALVVAALLIRIRGKRFTE
jgi:hypothetical protein